MKFECFNSPDESLDIDLHYCGYQDCEIGYHEGPTIRKAYVIHFAVGGSGYVINGPGAYKVNDGDCFLIEPGSVHYYCCESDPAWSIFWFSFNGKNAERFLKLTGLTLESPVSSVCRDCMGEFKQSVLRLSELTKGGGKMEILSELYNLFSLFERENKKQAAPSPKANEYVKRALTYMEYEYSNFITVTDVVNYLSLNRSYFSKIFKEQTGTSPKQYLQDLRINKAEELIKSTELKLCEICKCVGIREEYYFWRLFKRKCGMSPSKYRVFARKNK